MVAFSCATGFLILYYITFASVAALPTTQVNSTTNYLQKRQILHIGDADDLWCDRVLFEDYTSNGCTGNTYYSGRTPVEADKNTDLSNLDRGDGILLAKKNPPGITEVCDLVIPPSYVLQLLRTSGVCKKAAENSAAGKTGIAEALDKLNVPNNRRFLQRARLMDFKTRLIRPKAPTLGDKAPTALEKLKLMSYVLSQSTQTEAVAKSIDTEMNTRFKINPGIHDAWSTRLKKIRTLRNLLAEQIERDNDCGSQPGSPMDTSPGRKRSKRAETRFLHTLGSSEEGFTFQPMSTLERRVRPARSGPKAAKAPSCPLKKPPPKKPIPRSTVQQKPKPAVKPRLPAKAPQPRKPSPTKKVAPRPATRARRTPGKAATPKRTTPKVKPRVVPKPTRKPKGKPRTRRRT